MYFVFFWLQECNVVYLPRYCNSVWYCFYLVIHYNNSKYNIHIQWLSTFHLFNLWSLLCECNYLHKCGQIAFSYSINSRSSSSLLMAMHYCTSIALYWSCCNFRQPLHLHWVLPSPYFSKLWDFTYLLFRSSWPEL